jgi:multidrug transporter EmrE-like cation transporter
MSPFMFVAFSTIFGISGQLLLKNGMNGVSKASQGGTSMMRGIIFSPWVIGGLGIYGLGVLFWLMALSHFELSYIYPFASLSYIGIIVGSYLIFKEKLTVMRLVGVAVIIAGVLITSQS